MRLTMLPDQICQPMWSKQKQRICGCPVHPAKLAFQHLSPACTDPARALPGLAVAQQTRGAICSCSALLVPGQQASEGIAERAGWQVREASLKVLCAERVLLACKHKQHWLAAYLCGRTRTHTRMRASCVCTRLPVHMHANVCQPQSCCESGDKQQLTLSLLDLEHLSYGAALQLTLHICSCWQQALLKPLSLQGLCCLSAACAAQVLQT